MDEKTTSVVNNICAILGGALLLYPLIDEATKTVIPEMQKLTSSEAVQQLKPMLPETEKQPQKEEKYQEQPAQEDYRYRSERNQDEC